LIASNKNPDNLVVVMVECKGGSGSLTSREITHGAAAGLGQRAQQGSSQYRQSIIANMRDAAQKMPDSQLKTDLLETIRIIDDASLEGKAHYVLMRQEINVDGSLGNFIVSEF
jgi:hypothetical protein